MTLAKAKALAADLLDAGCQVRVYYGPLSATWEVEASRSGNPVTAAQLNSFATTHAVTTEVGQAVFK